MSENNDNKMDLNMNSDKKADKNADEKTVNTPDKDRRLLKGAPMMVGSILLVLVILPMIFSLEPAFSDFLTGAGVDCSPNLNDGEVIARFRDAAADLLREVPVGANYGEAARALDIREFAVKRVKFSPLAGAGIDARLNLVFCFDGKLPNPLLSKQDFSLPVMHVYIKAPGKERQQVESGLLAEPGFADVDWDYQVIVDGLHDQARIFDPRGKLLGRGLGLYVAHSSEGGFFNADKVSSHRDSKKEKKAGYTRITAALPMDLLGDPAEGEWRYYVAVGLADLRSPSMVYPRESGELNDIFDIVMPGYGDAGEKGQPAHIFKPLVVKNKR